MRKEIGRGPFDGFLWGTWNQNRVGFTGSGRYLVVHHQFSGRGTPWKGMETGIYRVSDWQRVWYSADAWSPVVSPDGKRLAVVRPSTNTLEIGPFAGD